ncbi:putative ribonuclease H-like domain-containing protein [Tanacetum coccineum]|uniref:Ribonuclease H-like domain-containing protein n=1 Tax=Tanacetum coccineum TaxID=301880 RepID=A0ABQ5E273_9ASTR
MNVSPIPTTRIYKDHPKDQIIGYINSATQTRRMTKISEEHAMIEAMQEELLQFKLQKVWTLVDLPNGKRAIGTKWVFRNNIDERGIMDVKSAFLYGTINKEVYVCQPPGFEDPQFPDKVYKVEKALYGLHQAPRAWYETLSTYLLENRFRRGTIDKTLFIKKDKGDILLVQVYVDDIIFGSTKKSLCVEFEQMMHKRFQMSSMGELTFFFGLQVKHKDDGIFISQDKYVADILKKFDFSTVKTVSTLIETNKALLKDEEAEDVDVHLYKSMIGSLMYLTASRPDIMFAVCACARFQVTPKVSHLHRVKRIFRYLKVIMLELVDFLTASSVYYALTVSPTIYASYIEQFWNTAHSQTVNDVKQIHATIDGKTVVISESSVRSDLYFNDENGITCLTNDAIFENLALMGQALQEDTQFPQTSVPIPNVADKVVFKEWDDIVVRATTTAASLDAAQARDNISKTQSTTRSERSSKHSYDSPLLGGGHTPGSDEDLVIRKLKKKVKKLENKIRARTPGMKLFKIGTSKRKSLDEKYVSKQGRKSDKTRPMFDDSDFSKLDVDNAMENVEGDVETQGRNTAEQITTNRDTVNTTSIDVSAAGPSNVSTDDPSTSIAGDIFKDEIMIIADTLVAIRSTRPRTTLVVIHDVEKEPRRATPVPIVQSQEKGKGKMVEPEPTPKNPIKAQIQRDAKITQRLHEKEKAELEITQRERADALLAARLQEKEREQFSIDEQARFLVETIAERKRFFAAQRAEQIRNKPPTKIQLRNKMITYLKNMGRFTYNQLKNKSFEEIQKLYEKEQKWIKDFILIDSEEGGKKAASSKKRPRAEPDEESVKRQKIGETSGSGEEQSAEKEKELSEEELQKLLVVVPVEEVYVKALQVKYPIIDWEVYSEDTRRYWRIIRVGNPTEAYQIFADMLKKFNKDDLVKIWDLVKKMFNTTEPTDDKEKELWVELKRLFEPDNDDIMWKLQRYMHDPLVRRLYDTCGVHHVSSVRGHDIFMLVEKEYPLTRGTLRLMMVARLLVEADSEMFRELLRKIFYQANRPRQ